MDRRVAFGPRDDNSVEGTPPIALRHRLREAAALCAIPKQYMDGLSEKFRHARLLPSAYTSSMKILLPCLIAFAAATSSLASEPLPFVQIGKSYTVMFGGDAFVVTVKQDAGKGWYRAQLAGVEGDTFINLATATIIASTPETSRVDAAALDKTITNNLRMLAGAADQYFLETGKKEVMAKELVGPTAFIKSLRSVDGENYLNLVIVQGRPLKVKTASGKEYSYEF